MIPRKHSANIKHTFSGSIVQQTSFEGEECGGKCLQDTQKTFRKLLVKSNLHTLFLLNVVTCYCLLYNMILDGRDVDVNVIMQQMEQKDVQGGIRRHQRHRVDA
jgi:hypothetical protein